MSGLTDRFFGRVYDLVREIPLGRVATYGQIAVLLGVPRGARAVGWALRALPEEEQRRVPWHRVIGTGGRISPRAGPGPQIQRRLLVAEGVGFRNGRVDLARHALLAPTDRRSPRRSRRPGPAGEGPQPGAAPGYDSIDTRGRRSVSRAR
ncbi:MAG TPA: MGMT family protein [Vicinamibacteria bacterium]|nr:MGMT family protein [Vicinamibacteria bacterium]